MSVYLPRNARALLHAKQLGGEIKYLRQGEIDARNRGYSPYSTETWRAWEYWATKAGCSHMLTKPDHAGHRSAAPYPLSVSCWSGAGKFTSLRKQLLPPSRSGRPPVLRAAAHAAVPACGLLKE